jgi:hypothetical protein
MIVVVVALKIIPHSLEIGHPNQPVQGLGVSLEETKKQKRVPVVASLLSALPLVLVLVLIPLLLPLEVMLSTAYLLPIFFPSSLFAVQTNRQS